MTKKFNIDENIIENNCSYRGGVIKVDVSSLFPSIDNPVMGAYQNYLGGGMPGSIVGASMFTPEELTEKELKLFFSIKEKIKKYYFKSLNGGVFNKKEYNAMQSMPVSAY